MGIAKETVINSSMFAAMSKDEIAVEGVGIRVISITNVKRVEHSFVHIVTGLGDGCSSKSSDEVVQ